MYREDWWALDNSDDILPNFPGPTSTEGPNSTTSPFNTVEDGGCAVEEIMTALEGCIMTDLLPLASHDRKTVSGRVSYEPPPSSLLHGTNKVILYRQILTKIFYFSLLALESEMIFQSFYEFVLSEFVDVVIFQIVG